MQQMEMPTFFAQLLKLGTARGEIPSAERMEIYFDDLADFPLSQVLEAIAWARKNLNHFPSIPELRTCIEGDPEVHAEDAWRAIRTLMAVDARDSLIIPDAVMAKTMQDLWHGWPHICSDVGNIDSSFDMANAQKSFKRAYLENWKRRDSLPANVRFRGTVEYEADRGSLYFHDERSIYIKTYTLTNGRVTFVGQREVTSPHVGKVWGMSPEMKARVDAFMKGVGKGGTTNAQHPAVPGRTHQPAAHIWDVSDPADQLGDKSPAPAVQPLRVVPAPAEQPVGDGKPGYCTCSGVIAGGACNCPWRS